MAGRLSDVEAAGQIVARLPMFAGTRPQLALLTGGLTNRNYHVRGADGTQYVARFAGPKTELLAIDRVAERSNSQLAAAAGVGPRVAAYSADDELLVVDWIESRTLASADLDDPGQLERVAGLCRTLHSGRPFAGDFDMFTVQRGYLHIVRQYGFRLPDGYADYAPKVRDIEAALLASAGPTVPCHNDLLAANILDDGARLWFIDYEYAGNNDRCFELGNIWSEAALADDRLDHLVASYFGSASAVQTARARLYALMAKYGWTLWASIQDGVSEVDFDFWDWGMEKYDRAEREFRSPVLDDLISTVWESVR